MCTRIEDCEFTFKCPRTWEQLDQTDDDNVRFCGFCARHVHLCSTREALMKHAQARQCIAVREEDLPPYGTSVAWQGNRKTEDPKGNLMMVGMAEALSCDPSTGQHSKRANESRSVT